MACGPGQLRLEDAPKPGNTHCWSTHRDRHRSAGRRSPDRRTAGKLATVWGGAARPDRLCLLGVAVARRAGRRGEEGGAAAPTARPATSPFLSAARASGHTHAYTHTNTDRRGVCFGPRRSGSGSPAGAAGPAGLGECASRTGAAAAWERVDRLAAATFREVTKPASGALGRRAAARYRPRSEHGDRLGARSAPVIPG